MTIFKFIPLYASFFFLARKSEQGFKEDKNFIGGQKVTADVLSHGKQVYLEYCMACHGLKGDGNGPAAKGSFPPPRNFHTRPL
jgi:mono/diheme cytochrome c family protein